MMGQILYGPRGLRTRLTREEALGLPLLRAQTAGQRPGAVRRAARALRKQGVRRALAPPGFLDWELLEGQGIRPVETGDFCRALAPAIALAALKGMGIPPEQGVVVLRGERVTRALRLTALALCPRVKGVLVDAPSGGEALRRELRREYGVPALEDGPGRRAQLALHFSPAAGRGERLADLSGPAPALTDYHFGLEGEMLPEDCEALPLLSALWESGRLGLGEVQVVAHFHS